jgi:hypothetical protein
MEWQFWYGFLGGVPVGALITFICFELAYRYIKSLLRREEREDSRAWAQLQKRWHRESIDPMDTMGDDYDDGD